MVHKVNFLQQWFGHLTAPWYTDVNENNNMAQIPTVVDKFNLLDSEDSHRTIENSINGQENTGTYQGSVTPHVTEKTAFNPLKHVPGQIPDLPPTYLKETSQRPKLNEQNGPSDINKGPLSRATFYEDARDDKPDNQGVRNHEYPPLGYRGYSRSHQASGGVGLSYDACGSSVSSGSIPTIGSSETPDSHETRRPSEIQDRSHTEVPNRLHAPEYLYESSKNKNVPKQNRPDLKTGRSYPRTSENYGGKHEYQEEARKCHQGISTLFRKFTPTEFTWTILKDLDDQLVDRDLVQLKFLCKDCVASSSMHQVERAFELFELLQSRALISDRRYHMLAELMYRIRRIDLLKKLVTDTKQYQELMKITPTSLSKYRILLHEICEDIIEKEFKTMKFFVRGHFHKPKLTAMKDPQDLFIALEQKDMLGADNLDLLLQLMEAADKGNMVKKIMEFRGSHFPDNPPPLDVFNKQVEVEVRTKTRSYGMGATAQFAGGSLGPLFRNQRQDMYYNEERPLENESNVHERVENQLNIGGHFNDNYRPSMLLSVGAAPVCEDDLDGDLPCYKMDASPRGLCVIFNNKHFHKVANDDESRDLKPREGSDIDRDNLEYTFTKLDFKIEMYENVTAQQLVNTMHHYAMNTDHSQYDCFVCCILTHGKKDKLYGNDGRLVEIRELTNFFKAAFCPTLRGKPKLFFIQACQGREKQQGYVPEEQPFFRKGLETDDAGQSEDSRDSIPNEADFLLAYATLPGFVSYRSRTHGSWFVNALVENIERYAHKYDLLSIMIKVNEEVSKMTAPMNDGDFKQVPIPHPTLRKRIFLKKNR